MSSGSSKAIIATVLFTGGLIALANCEPPKPPKLDADGLPIGEDWTRMADYMAKKQVTESLRDPNSAEFRALKTYHQADRRTAAVCGEVNAKNGYGGYTGFQPFVAIVTYNGISPNGNTNYLIRQAVAGNDVGSALYLAWAPNHCREGGGLVPSQASPSPISAAPPTRPAPSATLPTQAPSGPSPERQLAALKQGANVRAAPNGSAAINRTLPARSTVQIHSQNGAWYEVGDERSWGYVHNSLLEIQR